MTPLQFEREMTAYLGSPGAVDAVAAQLKVGGRSAAEDVVQDAYLALTRTARNKAERGDQFWMTSSDEVAAYILRATRNLANRRARGLIREIEKSAETHTKDRDNDALDYLTGPANPWSADPTDPHAMLDRIQVAVETAATTDKRGLCPGCGTDSLLGILAGILEDAHDQLDNPYRKDDAYDTITRADECARSIYRAIARSRGDDKVLNPHGRLGAAARQVMCRCRPCVEHILAEVIVWIDTAPTDWAERTDQGLVDDPPSVTSRPTAL